MMHLSSLRFAKLVCEWSHVWGHYECGHGGWDHYEQDYKRGHLDGWYTMNRAGMSGATLTIRATNRQLFNWLRHNVTVAPLTVPYTHQGDPTMAMTPPHIWVVALHIPCRFMMAIANLIWYTKIVYIVCGIVEQ